MKTTTEIWKERYEKLKIELNLRKLVGSQSQLKDEVIKELVNKLFDTRNDLEKTEEEISELKKLIADKEKGSLPVDDKKKELENKEEEQKRLKDDNRKQKDQLANRYRSTQEQIGELRKIKDDYIKEIKEKYLEFALEELNKKGADEGKIDLENINQNIKQKLESLLKEQEKETKTGSILAGEEKEKLHKVLAKFLREDEDKLNKLCETQKKQKQLETNQEAMENCSQVFNFVLTLINEPIGLRAEVKEDKKVEDDIVEKVGEYHTIYPDGFLESFKNRRTTNLPTKLIDLNEAINKKHDLKSIKADKVESGKAENYAILSYSWGSPPWAKFKEDNEDINKYLHNGGGKSLHKAIKALETINKKEDDDNKINYLWMDCYCIVQEEKDSIDQELKKVRDCYGNAKVTLIPIQRKIIEDIQLDHLNPGGRKVDMKQVFSTALDIMRKITNSNWFRRSWTFQEGLLSPQTIFMFDDVLIDGRFLAMVWSIKPEISLPQINSKDEFRVFLKKHSKKAATPLGWTYYEHEIDPKDEINLGLCQALKVVEKRERSMSADGIYSILGLLPYGNKINPEYKDNNNKEKSLDGVLVSVMKAAVENGYGEPLAWYGEGNSNSPGQCWLPKIEENRVSIEWLVEERIECEPDSVEFTDNGIKIKKVSEYKITQPGNPPVGSDNDKLWGRKLLVEVEDSSDSKEVNLQGMHETLKGIGSGGNYILLVPNMEQWKSKPPVALLATKNPGEDVYHRIDLVRILQGTENLTNEEKSLIIGMNNSSDMLSLNVDDIKLEKKESQKVAPISYETRIEQANNHNNYKK